MNSTYFKLIVLVTLKHSRESKDVILRACRTLPFQPYEGMTLVLCNDDGDEHEIVLGPPRYEFAESAFVEYQEDDTLLDYMREEEYTPESRKELIDFYKSFGFEDVTPVPVIEQLREQA